MGSHMSCVLWVLFSFESFFFFWGLLEQIYNGDENCFDLDFPFYCLGIGVCCG